MFAILWSIAWWAAIIIGGMSLGYKAAIFGILMSMITAIMIAWLFGKTGCEEENE
jgi:high-affinity Fe2+/Pb2+ permease